MQKLLVTLTALLQLASPVGALAAEAPLSDIFIDDPEPEFSERHTREEPWPGHREYHRGIVQEMKGWEEEWIRKQVTPPYTQEKRAALRKLQAVHRFAHRLGRAPGVGMENVTIPAQATGSASNPRLRVLAKRSHRLLVKEVMERERK